MTNNLLLSSTMKGIIGSISIFILSKLYIAIAWASQAYEILTIVYYLLIICLISFINKNKSLKGYLISASIFTTTSICIELTLSYTVINRIFKFIFGLDAEMWAGDGFMILTTSIATVISCIIGLLIAFIFSFVAKKHNDRKQRIN